MNKFRQLVSVVVLATFMLGTTACNERVVYTSSALSGGQTVSGSATGVSQEQFDLQSAIGLLRTNRVRDAQSLEAAINDPASGINNLDLDGDGQIDYIGIQESVSGNERHMIFMSCPSSKVGDPTKIADVTIRDDGGQVYVGGGYSSVFTGYNNAYYSYYVPRSSFSDALFLAWMLTPSRPYYMYHPYSYGWAPRPLYSPSAWHTTRTTSTVTREVRMAPVQKVAPPANYGKTAAVKMPPALAARPAGQGLSGSAGQMRDYRVNTKPAQAGTAFGATSRPAASPTPPSFTPKPASSGWGSGSSRMGGSGWGSGSSSARPSGGSGWGSGSSASKPASSGWGGGSSRMGSGSSGSSRRK